MPRCRFYDRSTAQQGFVGDTVPALDHAGICDHHIGCSQQATIILTVELRVLHGKVSGTVGSTGHDQVVGLILQGFGYLVNAPFPEWHYRYKPVVCLPAVHVGPERHAHRIGVRYGSGSKAL